MAEDAFRAVKRWDEETFADWRKALYLERHGRFMGAERTKRFGLVLMPEIMFRVEIVATQFHVPWGCAYIRLRELGHLKESRGIARMVESVHWRDENGRAEG
ncbi:MAG: hypothetical protein GEU71_18120 [Actinobacteria bacterium]|nr:hypothetical protein [Actinomycetota bacterium]